MSLFSEGFLGILNDWGFVVAVLVFLAIPGPGMFACLTAVTRGGLRGGYAVDMRLSSESSLVIGA